MKEALISFVCLPLFAYLLWIGYEYENPQHKPIDGLNEQKQSEYKIKFLFEVDGVKIYRFHDRGEYRYFATKGGSVLNQTQSRRVGKRTIYYDSGVIDEADGVRNE